MYKQKILTEGPNSVEPIPIRVHNGQALIVDGYHRYFILKKEKNNG